MKYRIVCTWPGEEWLVQERIEKDDHSTDWMEVHQCTIKGDKGYKEAKQWILLNGAITNSL